MSVPQQKPPRPTAADAPVELPTLRFRAALTRGPSDAASWTWFDVPERVSRALAPWTKAGHVRVDATFDGAAVQCSLTPRGGGRHLLVASAAVRREANLSPGRTVAVTVTPRVTDAVRVPDDLAAALASEGARAAFEALDSSHRWSLVRYVLGARTDTTRARLVARAVDHVLGRAPEAAAPVSRRRPSGWHCPACGKRFPRVDAEHHCAPLSLDLPFAGRPAAVRALFDVLRARVTAEADVTMAVQREGVSFLGRRRFLSAVPRRAWLEVRFTMARRAEHPGVKAITLGPAMHIHVARLRTEAELEAAMTTLLREAIAYGAPPGVEPAETSEGRASTGWERDVDDSYFAGLLED